MFVSNWNYTIGRTIINEWQFYLAHCVRQRIFKYSKCIQTNTSAKGNGDTHSVAVVEIPKHDENDTNSKRTAKNRIRQKQNICKTRVCDDWLHSTFVWHTEIRDVFLHSFLFSHLFAFGSKKKFIWKRMTIVANHSYPNKVLVFEH